VIRRDKALAGAACGLLLWLLCYFEVRHIPAAAAFYVTAFAFIFGCGALPLVPLVEDTSTPERTAIACALGTALSPLLVYVSTVSRCGFLFPPLAFAATGAALALWYWKPESRVPSHAEGRWYAIVLLLVFAIATWVSWGRIGVARDSLAVFGDYDTFDLTYGAAMASELSHSIPPASPFYAGHWLVYSYFPLLLLAAIHNFSGVPTTQICVELGWPFFATVASATVFAFCRRLGSVPFAALSAVLVLTGSSLAYVAAWLWPEMVKNDPLVWSSMFMAPSAESLYFNAWTPALVVVFAGLYALTRMGESTGRLWTLVAGVCFGLLFMFKSFAFVLAVPAVVIAGLLGAWRRDPLAARLIAVAAVAAVCAMPWLIPILILNRAEQRAAVTIEWLSLVRRMLFKADLTSSLAAFAESLVGSDPHRWALLSIGTVIFLIGGLGTRCLGIPSLWKAAIGSPSMRRWTPLAWMAVLGVAIPFGIAVAPFPNSIQAYQLGLFALWPFAAHTAWPPLARPSPGRWIATAALVAVSIPATVHYVQAVHAGASGPPITSLDAGGLRVVRYLRRSDPEKTVVLHSDTLWASLYAIESERRVVLAWSGYVAGDGNDDVDARAAEIVRFFGSPAASGADDVSILRHHHVTHVIERVATDRLHPHVVEQLHLVTGSPGVRLYEVPSSLMQ
jgi:hypothetical protein